MKPINEKQDLEQKITFLKNKQAADFLALKNQYYATIDSFKPMNLIKNSFQEALTTPGLKSSLINGAIGFGTSYFAKNLLNETSSNPVKRVFGNVLKWVLKQGNPFKTNIKL